jgi:N-acetylglutamate synthase-like GNAT family acetyltransferase
LNALELKEVRQCQGSILGCCTIYSNLWPDAHLLVTVAAAPPWVLAGFGESIFLI